MPEFTPKGDGFIVEGELTLGYYCGFKLAQRVFTLIMLHVLHGAAYERTFRKVRITVEPIED